MCGIVGVIGGTTKAEEKAVKQLIEVNTIRGYHSTGVVKVDFNFGVSWLKKAVNGVEFFEYKQTENLLNGRAVIAHNRQATKGSVNHMNAHPFQYGEFVGVHNGTLRKQHLLPDHKKFEVDSENIFYSFDKIGVDATINNLHGAYALVWYNAKDHTISMIRNEERPLHYCYTKDKKKLFYASEAKMLEWILDKNFIKHEPIVSLPTDSLTTFEVPAYGKELKAPRIRTLKGFKVPEVEVLKVESNNKNKKNRKVEKLSVRKQLKEFLGKFMEFQSGGIALNVFGRPYFKLLPLKDITVDGRDIEVRVVREALFKDLEKHAKTGGTFRAQLAKTANSSENPYYIVVMEETLAFIPPEEEDEVEEEMYYGYMDSLLTEAAYREATKKGCAWCASPVDLKADNVFIDDKTFLCPECAEDDQVKAYLYVGGK